MRPSRAISLRRNSHDSWSQVQYHNWDTHARKTAIQISASMTVVPSEPNRKRGARLR
jgi:hypothetical protein